MNCRNCNKELEGRYQKIYCSHSCSAIYNNNRKNSGKKRHCLYCNSELNFGISKYKHPKKYCNYECCLNYNEKININKATNGEKANLKIIKRFLMKEANNKCTKCGWSEIHPITKNIPLHLDHIDGDKTNNKKENLRILCPNCHSLTPTFGALNIKGYKHSKILIDEIIAE